MCMLTRAHVTHRGSLTLLGLTLLSGTALSVAVPIIVATVLVLPGFGSRGKTPPKSCEAFFVEFVVLAAK